MKKNWNLQITSFTILLMWIFCHKLAYLKMQNIHHKFLKVIYQSDASYDDLLQLNNSMSLHQRHLVNGTDTNDLYWWKYGTYETTCHTSNTERFHITCGRVQYFLFHPQRSTIYGTNSVHFLGSLICSGLPNLVKSSRSISEFKNVIKNSEILTAGSWYVEGSTLSANFHVILVFLCVL